VEAGKKTTEKIVEKINNFRNLISKSINFVIMNEAENSTIALACDHAGYEKKQIIMKYFIKKGVPFKDLGCYSSESCDYPDYGHLIGDAIDRGQYKRGISFCGSGLGISMTANKHQHVRSAVCWRPEIAALSKQHNDANICAIPSRFVTDDEVIAIVEAYLNATFEGGRHARRVTKIPIRS
jgi:ribose 5-phosphate isomerase B